MSGRGVRVCSERGKAGEACSCETQPEVMNGLGDELKTNGNIRLAIRLVRCWVEIREDEMECKVRM